MWHINKNGQQDSDSGGEVTSDCCIDSDQCEFGPNLSLHVFRYQFMRPVDRRCTYCGDYKGKSAKTILEWLNNDWIMNPTVKAD